jgi:hypothetical protein
MFKLKNKQDSNFKKISKDFLLLLPLVTSACATTNKGKILETIAVGAAAGAAYGQNRPEFKNENALMYGAIGGLTGSLIGLYVFDEEKKTDELKTKISKLEAELDSFGKNSLHENTSSVSSQNPASKVQLQSFLPKKLQKLVKPGEWSLYRIDDWEQLDDTKLVHKDQVLEFKPPELIAPDNKKE